MNFNERLKKIEEVAEKIKDLAPELQKEAFQYVLYGGATTKATSIEAEKDLAPQAERRIRRARGPRKKVSGILVQVEGLINSDFFNTPKVMKEILEELSRKGFNIQAPYLSPILIKLVRNGRLLRHKDSEERKYTYYKPKEN